MISKKTVEINDVKYVNELAKIPVILSPIDFTAELILSVTSLGSLSICVSEKLTICSASFCSDGVALIKLLTLEIIIGAINATTIAIIAIKPIKIVVILAQRGKPHFSRILWKVSRYRIKIR